MNPNQPQGDDALQNVYNPLKVMQPGERVMCEIRRHPFGLLGTYFMFVLVVIIAVCAVVLAPRLVSTMTSQDQAIVALGAVIICALTGLFTYVGSVVYKGNRWIVTSDSITQVDQVSLFSKQTSQLSMANLEDVTVQQTGILQSMFGFGSLRAESAGERGKFVFNYCPRPNDYAKQIIAAHEAYIAQKPDEMHVTNQPLAAAPSFNQSYESRQMQPNPVSPQQNGQMPPQNPQYYDPTQPASQPQSPQSPADQSSQSSQ